MYKQGHLFDLDENETKKEKIFECQMWPNSIKIFTINNEEYIPLPFVWFFSSYSYSRVRWLIKEGEISRDEILKICNLYFIKKSYIPILEKRRYINKKRWSEEYMIKQHYSKFK